MTTLAGTRYTNWWIPSGVSAFNPPVRQLTLADFDRSGLTLVNSRGADLLALLVAERNGDEIYNSANNLGMLIDGSLEVSQAVLINRIRVEQSGDQLTFNRSGGGAFSTHFTSGGTFPSPIVHIQTLAGRSNIPVDAIGSGFVRFDQGSDDDIANDIVTGDRFIIAISYSPHHRQNAGEVIWAFAVAQPTVIHGGSQSRDAGDVAFAFVVTEPTISTTRMRTANAGDAAFAFAIPQPTVTFNMVVQSQVNAGDVSYAFALPQPTVTHTGAVATRAFGAGFGGGFG